MKPVEMLKAAITKSGLSSSGYATEILTRDPRTVRRWLDGETPIPPVVVEFLHRELEKAPA